MTIQENVSLKHLNTFGVEANARWFIDIKTQEDLSELFADNQLKNYPCLIMGGGSNILFTQDFHGLVVHINIQGISNTILNNDVYVKAGGGVVWNDLVNYCVDKEFAGIENLSLIPGSVGASPVQNIGAYGVELENIFHS